MINLKEAIAAEERAYKEFVRHENLLEELKKNNLTDEYWALMDDELIYIYNWTIYKIEKFINILNMYHVDIEIAGNYKYIVHDNRLK